MDMALKERAWKFLKGRVHRVESLEEGKVAIEKRSGVVEMPWCFSEECGKKVEEELGASVLGSPIENVSVERPCIVCGNKAKTLIRVAKTY